MPEAAGRVLIVRIVEVAPLTKKAEALLVGVVKATVPLTIKEVELAAPAVVTVKLFPPTVKLALVTSAPLVKEAKPLAERVETLVAAAEREPSDVPPWTVSPVVVALLEIRFARLVKPETPREPNEVPPVTVNDVEVPAEKTKLPSSVPP